MIQTTILMDIIKTGKLSEALCLLLVKIYGKKSINKYLLYSTAPQPKSIQAGDGIEECACM